MAGKSAGSRKTTQGKTLSSRTASEKQQRKMDIPSLQEQEEFCDQSICDRFPLLGSPSFLSNFKLCGFIGDYLRSFQLGILERLALLSGFTVCGNLFCIV